MSLMLSLPPYQEDDEVDTSSALDVACPVGQQLIGALFGFLTAYIGLLCCGNSKIVLSLLLSVGASFGTLAAAVYNPFDIALRDFLPIFLTAEIICMAIFSIVDCGSMPTLLVTSMLVSFVSSNVRFMFRMCGFIELKGKNIPRTSERLRV